MAKWSGKVFFPTSSQASRSMAYGRYPSLPFEAWKPRPERQRISIDRARLDGVLVMLDYGLRVMSDSRLSSLAGVLQDELDRNAQRWVPLDVRPFERAAQLIRQEQCRRHELLNPAERLRHWFMPTPTRTTWTQQDAEKLRTGWEDLLTEEEPS